MTEDHNAKVGDMNEETGGCPVRAPGGSAHMASRKTGRAIVSL